MEFFLRLEMRVGNGGAKANEIGLADGRGDERLLRVHNRKTDGR